MKLIKKIIGFPITLPLITIFFVFGLLCFIFNPKITHINIDVKGE